MLLAVHSHGQAPPGSSGGSPYIDDWIQEDNGTVRQILHPTEGEKLTIGKPYLVAPYVCPNRKLRSVNYYLVDAEGNRKLLCVKGWEWCATGRRPLPERQQVPFDCYWDHTLITPGKYKLVVTHDQFGLGPKNSSTAILAESKLFQLVDDPELAQNAGTIIGKIQTSNSGLSAVNAQECIDNIRIQLRGEENAFHVYLAPDDNGSFTAALPVGTYSIAIQSSGEFKSRSNEKVSVMHLATEWLMLKQQPKEIILKPRQKLTVNLILTHNETQSRPGWHYCDVSYSP